MDVQVQRAAEALHDRNAPAAAARHAVAFGAGAEGAEYRAHEKADDLTADVMAPRELIPQTVWKAQDPLADRHIRQHVIDEMRGTLRRAAAAAAWTETASLARKRHEPIVAARGTAESRKTAGQEPAAQKRAEFVFDESG
jgi:hypothetical protein